MSKDQYAPLRPLYESFEQSAFQKLNINDREFKVQQDLALAHASALQIASHPQFETILSQVKQTVALLKESYTPRLPIGANVINLGLSRDEENTLAAFVADEAVEQQYQPPKGDSENNVLMKALFKRQILREMNIDNDHLYVAQFAKDSLSHENIAARLNAADQTPHIVLLYKNSRDQYRVIDSHDKLISHELNSYQKRCGFILEYMMNDHFSYRAVPYLKTQIEKAPLALTWSHKPS